ncbi:ATP synthase subunit I [Bradyrhizobium yuanmingense]|uniref:ATP synthase subunit I n=1 Tax=Bradyrhizobium yuanmingense TaxID=108015 RepID=UPI001CD31600|nr:ATP synthase subunit I [Bradyrhizobium yuanmingense]MCA1529062.1 ATP synthase subunit I [Bradyrhizobium yuanmingense]
MSISLFEVLPTGIQVLAMSGDLAAGIVLGLMYFGSLRWSVSRFAGGGGAARTIALMVFRFIVLGVVLTLASLAGALHLLAVTLGVFVGRSLILRRTRGAT